MADNNKTRKVFCIYPVGITGEENVIRVQGTRYEWFPDTGFASIFDDYYCVATFNLDNIVGNAEEMTLPTLQDAVWKDGKILV